MQPKKIRLDVDQIGGLEILSASDEKVISQYIQSQKRDIHPIKKKEGITKTKNP
jgi:hypothetical protein